MYITCGKAFKQYDTPVHIILTVYMFWYMATCHARIYSLKVQKVNNNTTDTLPI